MRQFVIPLLIFLFPVLSLGYKFWMYYTFAKIELPCGTLKVRRIFRYDMNVMVRIVAKEFFNGGTVDAETMKELYRKYGPLSWDEGRNFAERCWMGVKVWLKRFFAPNRF